LAVIHGHASFSAATEALPVDTIESATQIIAVAERAASLTGQLLLFSRRQVLRPLFIDVDAGMVDQIVPATRARESHLWFCHTSSSLSFQRKRRMRVTCCRAIRARESGLI
jgi:hypothetical protein